MASSSISRITSPLGWFKCGIFRGNNPDAFRMHKLNGQIQPLPFAFRGNCGLGILILPRDNHFVRPSFL